MAARSWTETQPVVPCAERVFRLCRGAHVPQRPSLSPGGSLALTLSSMSWAGDCPEEARVSGKRGVTRAATPVPTAHQSLSQSRGHRPLLSLMLPGLGEIRPSLQRWVLASGDLHEVFVHDHRCDDTSLPHPYSPCPVVLWAHPVLGPKEGALLIPACLPARPEGGRWAGMVLGEWKGTPQPQVWGHFLVGAQPGRQGGSLDPRPGCCGGLPTAGDLG